MVKKVFILGLALIALATNVFCVIKAEKQADRVAFTLEHLEALASNGEFETGPWGSNWREYTTDCTYTQTVNGSITVHIPGIADGSIGGTTSKTWTEYNKRVCGLGTGTCLLSAGC